MAARVIHFGVDECYRIRVLRRAGYEIEDCSNLLQFRSVLEPEVEADAIMVNDSDGRVPLQAISLARSRTSAPIILFPNPRRTYETCDIDLVVPSFTPPQDWLLDLANLIVRRRAVREFSQLLREQSQQLRQESAAVREKSRRERFRSGEIRGEKAPSPFDPNGGSNPE